MRAEALKEELAARNAEHGGRWYLELSYDVAAELAIGFVPSAVRAQALFLLSEIDGEQDRHRAKRSVKVKR